MKRLVIFSILMMFVIIPAVATAYENGEIQAYGGLFLFQKCDDSLIDTAGHDSFGCPIIGTGPWPIFRNSKRFGKLDYTLWGETFEFQFLAQGLLPDTKYTLIYYPDPWPGNNLICLGAGQSAPLKDKKCGRRGHGRWEPESGSLFFRGNADIGTEGLPASYDANFNPTGPSGAVGAKIWLVLSDDVQCTPPPPDGEAPVAEAPFVPHMVNWNPAAYLFEYNLIVFENRKVLDGETD